MRQRLAGGTGLLLAIASAATFGTSGTFATSLLDAGWSAGAAVSWRITIAALVLTPAALWQLHGRWQLLRQGATSILSFGLIAVAGCQFAYFSAVGHLSVGVALLLEYSGTVLVVGWLWARHGQRPRRLTLIGGALAVVGLALVLDLAGSHHLSLVGVLWGLGAATGLAVYFLQSGNAEQPLPPLVMAWGAMVVGAAALIVLDVSHALPYRAPHSTVSLAHHQVSWLVPILGLSLLAAAIAYIAGIGAARLLGAKVASFVGLLEVVCAVLFAWLLLDQVPTAVQLTGGAFIIAGIVAVRLDEVRGPRSVVATPEPVPLSPLT